MWTNDYNIALVLGQMCVYGARGTEEEGSYFCVGDKETKETFIEQVLLELSLLVSPNTYFLCIPETTCASRARS